MFVGPQGVGKRCFAFALAKTLLCRRHFTPGGDPDPDFDESKPWIAQEELARFTPCGECDSCKQFEQSDETLNGVARPTHPDFFYVAKPKDKTLFPLELLIGDKENRMRSGLCFDLNRTPFVGGRKIAVIDDADYFNQECSNALLKTLEEPPQDTLIFLIGTSASKQLPTIRSRCQIFRFKSLPEETVAEIMLNRGLVETKEEAAAVAKVANGSIHEAEKALDTKFNEFREYLMGELSKQPPLRAVELATKMNAFIDAAGKEPVLRRVRLRNVLKAAIDFYRAAYIAGEREEKLSEEQCAGNVTERYANRYASESYYYPSIVLACIERTLDALEQIDRNANLPFIVDAWCYELGDKTRV